MKRKTVADKAVRPAADKGPETVYLRLRPGRSVRIGGVLAIPGQYVRAEKALADELLASGYAELAREA